MRSSRPWRRRDTHHCCARPGGQPPRHPGRAGCASAALSRGERSWWPRPWRVNSRGPASVTCAIARMPSHFGSSTQPSPLGSCGRRRRGRCCAHSTAHLIVRAAVVRGLDPVRRRALARSAGSTTSIRAAIPARPPVAPWPRQRRETGLSRRCAVPPGAPTRAHFTDTHTVTLNVYRDGWVTTDTYRTIPHMSTRICEYAECGRTLTPQQVRSEVRLGRASSG